MREREREGQREREGEREITSGCYHGERYCCAGTRERARKIVRDLGWADSKKCSTLHVITSYL